MSERRYSESEVAAIFERATEAQQKGGGQQQLPSGEGMTLAQLQDIGREVGISPEMVEDAARGIDRVGRPMSRQLLGLPIGVGRTIQLGRKLSEAEWERFVVDLRETFDARGRLRTEGSLRQWTNGNLQALLEPTQTGHQIRLRTLKGGSVSLMAGGIGMVVIAVAAMAASMFRADNNMAQLGVLAVIGMGTFAFGALRLPGWARLREKQMEEIAARITSVAGSAPADEPGAAGH